MPIGFDGSPRVTLLSKELFDHLDDPIPVTTLVASPLWRVENGIVREVLPTRTKIWSPLRLTTGGDVYRMYAWTHADLWWRADELPLNDGVAEEAARVDALGLRVIRQGAPEVLSSPVVVNDAGAAAADEIERRCSSFENLLSQSGDDEESIHQWLLLPGNHIFLDLGALSMRSKVPFGAHVSDFVVSCAESKYLLCEIEPANTSSSSRMESPAVNSTTPCSRSSTGKGTFARMSTPCGPNNRCPVSMSLRARSFLVAGVRFLRSLPSPIVGGICGIGDATASRFRLTTTSSAECDS